MTFVWANLSISNFIIQRLWPSVLRYLIEIFIDIFLLGVWKCPCMYWTNELQQWLTVLSMAPHFAGIIFCLTLLCWHYLLSGITWLALSSVWHYFAGIIFCLTSLCWHYLLSGIISAKTISSFNIGNINVSKTMGYVCFYHSVELINVASLFFYHVILTLENTIAVKMYAHLL